MGTIELGCKPIMFANLSFETLAADFQHILVQFARYQKRVSSASTQKTTPNILALKDIAAGHFINHPP